MLGPAELHINQVAVTNLLYNPTQSVQMAMYRLSVAVGVEARALAPVDTGTLRRSIKVRKEATGFEVVVEVPYASAVIEGTGPHVIQAGGQALKFPSKAGTIVYSKEVMHPGTPPNDFLEQALLHVVGSMLV